MARPIKCRWVSSLPAATYFKPAGIPLRFLEENCLSIEEAEAIRLKDLEGLEQEECAGKMKISRPTFHRVLGSARRKLADALLNGKAIRIEGGNFELSSRRFRCPKGHEWELPSEGGADLPALCPRCGSRQLLPVSSTEVERGRRHRRGGCQMDGPQCAGSERQGQELKESSDEDRGD